MNPGIEVMTDTLFVEKEVMDEIEIKKELINTQNDKKNLIFGLTNNARYLHELLTKQDPGKLTELVGIIEEIEGIIECQYKKIGQARKEGINIKKIINRALYNELVVCKEIPTKLNDAPRLIEKLDELGRKIARTMVEIRTNE